MKPWNIEPKYLLFIGDDFFTKTARGILEWRPELVVGKMTLKGIRCDFKIPELTCAEAVAAGCRTLVIGVAGHGGKLQPGWLPSLLEALDAGLDIASGLHARLRDTPELVDAAKRRGCRLWDVRHAPISFDVARGTPRSGRRLLTVGTDCEMGKMYTGLCLVREMERRGFDVDFRATGQTGIFISGSGVAVDAVVSDFVAGAAEWLSPANQENHWDVIEGQGSILHPAYAGVTLGLIHGSQPDAMVLCHDPTRKTLLSYPHFPMPPLDLCLRENLRAAHLTNPYACWVGVALNTSKMAEKDARAVLERTEAELSLPCVDPSRTGVARLVDTLEVRFGKPKATSV